MPSNECVTSVKRNDQWDSVTEQDSQASHTVVSVNHVVTFATTPPRNLHGSLEVFKLREVTREMKHVNEMS
jgi:hypothetical protein